MEQIDDGVTLSAYDNLNRLTSQAPGGPIVVAGSLNEPGTVTISGVPTVLDANNNFRGTVSTTTGTNTFTIVAKDGSGNTTTQQYEIEMAGSTRTFSYDANGNQTSDGNRTLSWDARNQLLTVAAGSLEVGFGYDGAGRRVAEAVSDGTSTVSTTSIWCGRRTCEKRDSTNIVVRRYQRFGTEVGSTNSFVAFDHLNSVRVLTSGAAAVNSRIDYDPAGRPSVVSGTEPEIGFGGHTVEPVEGLVLTLLRAYDPAQARWLSEDPAGFVDGLNLFVYVLNNPVANIDPFGDQCCGCRVQVQCRPVSEPFGSIGLTHCYVVTQDRQCGVQTAEAFPTLPNGQGDNRAQNNAWVDGKDPDKSNKPQWDPTHATSSNCETVDCVRKNTDVWTAAKIKYQATGANSNSFVAWLNRTCNLGVRYFPKGALGWY